MQTAGGRRMSFDAGAQMRVWGGCWVTTGSGMLQFAAVDGERRSVFFDTWDIIEESPTAVTLLTKACATAGGKPRAVTLHAESRAVAHTCLTSWSSSAPRLDVRSEHLQVLCVCLQRALAASSGGERQSHCHCYVDRRARCGIQLACARRAG